MTDADDEDDGLKSLRAVWLSMPDEDPPERGLADLMAAARVKANEMTAKPSLWQRFMESLRRPPVLALATVTVLIGGAVLVSNRSKDMNAQPTVSAPQGEATTAVAEEKKEARDEGGASAGSAFPAEAPMPPAPVVGGAAEAELEAKPSADPTVVAIPKKKAEPRTGGSRDDRAKDAALSKSKTEESPKSGLEVDSRGDDATQFESDGDAMATKHAASKQEAAKNETAKTTTTTTAANGATAPTNQAPKDSAALSSTPSVAQLHQTARAAAARGDCDAVRRITGTIAKQDPAYYKAKVANDASVTRCALAQ